MLETNKQTNKHISFYFLCSVENVQKSILNVVTSEWFILLKISTKYSCHTPCLPPRDCYWGRIVAFWHQNHGLRAPLFSMEVIDPWVTWNSDSEWDDLEMLSGKPALMLLSWFVIPDHTSPCLLKDLFFVLWKMKVQSERIALVTSIGNMP